jgi:hypothetical protein
MAIADAVEAPKSTNRESLMTDVSNYAQLIGLNRPIYFSPQVLQAVVAPPFDVKSEDNVDRILRILANLGIFLSVQYGEDVVSFSAPISLEEIDDCATEDFELKAYIRPDNRIDVFLASEEATPASLRKAGKEKAKQVEKLKKELNPPRFPLLSY